MNDTQRELILQRWNVIQHELLPELKNEVGALTPKLERVIHTLEWVRIEEFTGTTWCGVQSSQLSTMSWSSAATFHCPISMR